MHRTGGFKPCTQQRTNPGNRPEGASSILVKFKRRKGVARGGHRIRGYVEVARLHPEPNKDPMRDQVFAGEAGPTQGAKVPD